MSTNPEPPEDAPGEVEQPRSHRRLAAVAAIGLLCLLALAAGLFALLRSGGGGGNDSSIPTVTFGPEGDATSIPEPAPGSLPLLQLSQDFGAPGTEVTLQGAAFKAGKGFRPVELYWDGADGLRLKLVDGPRFSVQVRIPPDAPVRPEGHNIVAVQRTKAGKLETQTAIHIFVVPPGR